MNFIYTLRNKKQKMKHLKRFNENSHDWRANAFHGAPDEEIDKIIGQDADNHSQQIYGDYHGSKSHTSYLKDIETEADLRSAVKEEPVEEVEVEEVEVEEDKPNVGSRIKNFLGFGKK